MTDFVERKARAAVSFAARLAASARRRSTAFGVLWRRSLQLRVVVSTLALGSAVIFVLGMVLQSQITLQLVAVKERNAGNLTSELAQTTQRELAGISQSTGDLSSRLNNALNKITSSGSSEGGIGSAGAFEPVLASTALSGAVFEAGPYEDVPLELRRFVQNAQNEVIGQNVTVTRDGQAVTYLIMGTTVTTSPPAVQLYMLYPLSGEQATVAVVQNTLIIGGLVLLALLAGITNLVTRQVVMPVRRAARAAERFAEGELDERMVVVGEDDVARLAQSYNEMAESIQRQIRQLEDFGQLQRRFTSDVSHELRTPLTTVRMAADVLHASRKQFPAGLARSTELLVDELDRFETLLADLLEISRLDAGVEELVADETDLRVIVRRAVDSVRVIAGNTGTDLVIDLPDEYVLAEVEPRRIERILRNLLGNAVDHADGRPVELRMAASDDAVAITVRDHGVGLRPGEAELVFNRFWRADASRNRQTGGTGLGLAISLEDARLHGGGLDAWGEPGTGACFRLTVPRVQGVDFATSPLPLPPVDTPDPEPVIEEAFP
ncbi:MtrAB system histidine kinase MtrB [Actinokineospora guangxiensis]|uniref:Sensor histidine kinase MtrB n=1 Tax=Actinokineospora guangxiensis TaxID=1490288 RepID=A0ABW0EY08_9PSEU